jgi:hypothetical protein
MRVRSGLLPLLCAAVAIAACGSDPDPLEWELAFESRALRTRAAVIEARIVKGGCASEEILYVTAFAPDELGGNPPELAEGTYGLLARAQDAECMWYAQGCTEVELPRGGAKVVVTIAALDGETLDCDACQARQCGGMPDAGSDAGPPPDEEPDAGIDDAGSPPDDEDGGGVSDASEPDAAVPLEPVVISLEAEQAAMVQPPLLVSQDELASGGAYISYPWDSALTLQENQALKRATPPVDDAAGGLAFLEFAVPRTGEYRLWGKVITPSLDEDSFWMRIDDGEWIQWNDISHQDQTWHWDDVRPFESRADRFMVPLAEGPHVLRVSYRELGSKLDRIVIASDLDWVPTD